MELKMTSPKKLVEHRTLRLENLEARRVLTLYSAHTIATGDFDRDGEDDLVIGKPYETVGYDVNAGLVEVIYGKTGGLSYTDRQTIHQDMPGILGTAEPGDLFGWSVAVGDFNNDGYDDLAIGAKNESVGNKARAGAVNVLYGSRSGLSTAGDQWWHQDKAGVIGVVEADDQFGFSLAAGDFDNDGYDDLAIGVNEEDLTRNGTVMTDAGQVSVLYGGSKGLSATGDQAWWQGRNGLQNVTEKYDRFGETLAVGDFNRDGYDDLAVGVPQEDWNSLSNSGVVHVIYGSSSGLTGTGDDLWHQNRSGIWSSNESDDYFGRALAVGDFDRDGYDDLAIGISEEDFSDSTDAGAVQIIYGGSSGLNSSGARAFSQGSSGVWGTREDYDRFGRRLAAGDFNNDGYDDLAVGVPEEDWNTTKNAGVTHVLYGTSGGLSATNDQIWHQNISGIWSSNEANDRFGSALATGDFNGDGYMDLAVEVDGEGLNGDSDHGAVNIIYGRSGGLSSTGDQVRYSRTYKIDVIFKDNNLSLSKQKLVIKAAERWTRVIYGNLPTFTVSGKGKVDDLVVEVSTRPIDGTSNILAQAGSKLLRSGSDLPATAEMTIDSADRNNSQLYDIVVHEFGHALGFVGWVVRKHGLFNSTETRFTGSNAAAQYRSIFGNSYTSVPMKKGEGHWKETIFKNELMTPYIDSNMRLSKVTVGAMKDLGYTVNYNFADSYSKPGSLLDRAYQGYAVSSNSPQEAMIEIRSGNNRAPQNLVIDAVALNKMDEKKTHALGHVNDQVRQLPLAESLMTYQSAYQIDEPDLFEESDRRESLKGKSNDVESNGLHQLEELTNQHP